MLILLSIVILFLILIVGTLLLIFLTRDSLVNSVPFIPVKNRALKDIVHALQLSEKSILYDLGCGDGRVLTESLKAMPMISTIGFERGIVPFLVAKIRTRKTSADVQFKNFFEISFGDATHIFCYLSNQVMGELAPKILRECRKGTRIVSCDFTFPDWKPVEIVPLTPRKNTLSKKLYVYEV